MIPTLSLSVRRPHIYIVSNFSDIAEYAGQSFLAPAINFWLNLVSTRLPHDFGKDMDETSSPDLLFGAY